MCRNWPETEVWRAIFAFFTPMIATKARFGLHERKQPLLSCQYTAKVGIQYKVEGTELNPL